MLCLRSTLLHYASALSPFSVGPATSLSAAFVGCNAGATERSVLEADRERHFFSSCYYGSPPAGAQAAAAKNNRNMIVRFRANAAPPSASSTRPRSKAPTLVRFYCQQDNGKKDKPDNEMPAIQQAIPALLSILVSTGTLIAAAAMLYSSSLRCSSRRCPRSSRRNSCSCRRIYAAAGSAAGDHQYAQRGADAPRRGGADPEVGQSSHPGQSVEVGGRLA